MALPDKDRAPVQPGTGLNGIGRGRLTRDADGVRRVLRSGATLAVRMPEGNRLIKAGGRITIVNRASLLEAADGSYGVAECEYARLIEGA